jgi:hypothetical protein
LQLTRSPQDAAHWLLRRRQFSFAQQLPQIDLDGRRDCSHGHIKDGVGEGLFEVIPDLLKRQT